VHIVVAVIEILYPKKNLKKMISAIKFNTTFTLVIWHHTWYLLARELGRL